MKIVFYLLFLIILGFTQAYAVTFTNKAQYYYVIESNSGKVIADRNGDKKMYPASMSKIMVLYIVFEKIREGQINLNTTTVVSRHAFIKAHYTKGYSSMFLREKEIVSVEELIKGVTVASGNDASIVLAELIAGDEDSFLKLMNDEAQKMRLTGTHFASVDGRHNINHYTTPKDLTTIAYRLIKDFPEYYHYFSILKFSHNNITQPNRNKLLSTTFNYKNIIVDGIKTGHTEISRYSSLFSAVNLDEDFRIIGVSGGYNSELDRMVETKKLISNIYDNYQGVLLYSKGQEINKLPIYNASKSSISLIASQNIFYLVPKNVDTSKVEISIVHNNYLYAPIKENSVLGKIIVKVPQNPEYNVSYNILATKEVKVRNIVTNILFAPYNAIRKFMKVN